MLVQVNLLKYDQGAYEFKSRGDFASKQEIRKLILSYNPKSVESSCVKMYIHLEDDKPIFQKPRRLAPKEREVVKNQVHEWLESGIIIVHIFCDPGWSVRIHKSTLRTLQLTCCFPALLKYNISGTDKKWLGTGIYG